MDTIRFELTRDELEEIYAKVNLGYPAIPNSRDRLVAKSQVAKVLSMLEPVELEALGDEELADAVSGNSKETPVGYMIYISERDRLITQATIRHNQKGQLFRLKEGQGNGISL